MYNPKSNTNKYVIFQRCFGWRFSSRVCSLLLLRSSESRQKTEGRLSRQQYIHPVNGVPSQPCSGELNYYICTFLRRRTRGRWGKMRFSSDKLEPKPLRRRLEINLTVFVLWFFFGHMSNWADSESARLLYYEMFNWKFLEITIKLAKFIFFLI